MILNPLRTARFFAPCGASISHTTATTEAVVVDPTQTTAWGAPLEVRTPLPGDFNVANALAAIRAAVSR